MVSVILYADGRGKAEIKRVHSYLADLSNVDQIIVGDSSLEAITAGVSIAPTDSGSILDAIRTALLAARSSQVVFIDAGAGLDIKIISQILADSENMEQTSVYYLPVESDDDQLMLEIDDAEGALTKINNGTEWPLVALGINSSAIEMINFDECKNFFEFAAQVIFTACSAGSKLEAFSATARLDKSKISDLLKPDQSTLSALLKCAVNTFAIEELFPTHAWREHPQESAAASYHTLAGMFIKLGDVQNALEALKLCDSLEESPRTLALRGLIAQLQGETLGAVANMVSSLQQYEARKKSEGHYISFQPTDIEIINSSLVSGLNALNKRQNAKALDHFSKAVFNFDSFYSQLGLDRIRQ